MDMRVLSHKAVHTQMELALYLGTLPRRASSEEYLGGDGTPTREKTYSDDNWFMHFIAIRMLTLPGLY